MENTYIIGFQGKTRQRDSGPGVSFLDVNTTGLTGGSAGAVTRMDGVNHYGIETLDLLLGSGSDVVSVQGTSRGSYKYDMDLTAVIETSTDGDGADVPEVQRLTLNAAGTFTLSLDGNTTAPITVDPADTSGLAQDIEDAINASLGVAVTVERNDEKFTITFVNASNPNEAELAIDASGLSPVHAVTNLSLGGNAQTEHVFVSSDADLDRDTIFETDGSADPFDFLAGNLDDLLGDLNIDFGDGRHGLMVSDEAAAEGDDNVVITDQMPAVADRNRLAKGNEIWITGLAFGGMSYVVDPSGNLFEGVVYWSGSGDDTIAIDGTHYRAGERTTTMLNTGMGNDSLTVDLDTGEDGFFVLNTMGGAESVDPHTSFGITEGSVSADDDFVDATASSLPLTIFGGIGDDEINSGTGNDFVFGDFGRIWYFDEEGEIVAVHGFGGRGDIMSSLDVDAKLMFTIDRNLGGDDILRGSQGEDVLVGGAASDRIDGGNVATAVDVLKDRDLVFGDNVSLDRRDDLYKDYTNPRFRTLPGVIYNDAGDPLVGTTDMNPPPGNGVQTYAAQPVWGDWDITLMDHSFDVESDPKNRFGNDYIAGGPADDTIFGQLGDDTIQGDGSIDLLDESQAPYDAGNVRDPETGELTVLGSFEAATDGDDYIEGNGGNDVIFGNLGQDDILGGSSDLFSLTDRLYRPDGTGVTDPAHGSGGDPDTLGLRNDILFGGAGTDLDRNNIGDASQDGNGTIVGITHGRDADMLLGDNGNIYRLVGTMDYDGDHAFTYGFLQFQYDQTSTSENRGTLRIIPRAAELLDYTPGGGDYAPNLVPGGYGDDIGAVDEIHGESGDDFLYGMAGNDILFGEGQDDDLVGGYGNDWISGGTGQDGILGDDGRIYTSRNNMIGETLYGIAGFANNELDAFIYTPGKIQQATINVEGALKKTFNLAPFNLAADETNDFSHTLPGFDPNTPTTSSTADGGATSSTAATATTRSRGRRRWKATGSATSSRRTTGRSG